MALCLFRMILSLAFSYSPFSICYGIDCLVLTIHPFHVFFSSFFIFDTNSHLERSESTRKDGRGAPRSSSTSKFLTSSSFLMYSQTQPSATINCLNLSTHLGICEHFTNTTFTNFKVELKKIASSKEKLNETFI